MESVKKEIITKTTKTVFIARDGAEFDYEKDCFNHECYLDEEDAMVKIKNMTMFDLNAPFEDMTYRWAYIRNAEELNTFITAVLNQEERNSFDYANDKELNAFPLWIVGIYDDEGYGGVYEAKYVISQYESFIANVRVTKLNTLIKNRRAKK